MNFLRLLALLLVAVPVAAAAADSRPRVGLVLSGGGARGAAHVGVLKVLEEMRVPIDAIAGTSMGAVVGGLYASGLSADEIDATLRAVNWEELLGDRPPRDDLSFRRKEEDRNFLVRLPLGLHGGEFRLPKGLVQGQRLNELLRKLTLPVATVHDFDALPTRFRAIATDLESGERGSHLVHAADGLAPAAGGGGRRERSGARGRVLTARRRVHRAEPA